MDSVVVVCFCWERITNADSPYRQQHTFNSCREEIAYYGKLNKTKLISRAAFEN